MAAPTKRHSLPPRPLHLTTSNLDSSSVTSSSSDVVSTTPLPPKRPVTKRQQSISYLPHNSDPRWSIRSPTAAPSPSIQSEGRNSPLSLAPPRENAPLTLAEKCVYHLSTRSPQALTNSVTRHADLLSFIAQKEAKCMELRTQLASQEEELTQLKRKWERIVNRGFDRVYVANGITPPQSTSGPMLEGIKEGVQEVSRMITAGLSDYGSAPLNSVHPVSALSRTHPTRWSTSSITTSSSGSTRFSHTSANSSLVEDDFLSESPEEGEVTGKRDQTRIFEEVSQSPTCAPILENLAAVEISKTSLDEDRVSKAFRRRSRDAPSGATRKVPSKFGQGRPREGKSPVLPTSSMPGLGTLPSGTPSWVLGTVGKKWEELQQTETYVYSHPSRPCSVLHLNLTKFQFHKKPETCIGVIGGYVSVPVKRMVLPDTIPC